MARKAETFRGFTTYLYVIVSVRIYMVTCLTAGNMDSFKLMNVFGTSIIRALGLFKTTANIVTYFI